MLKKQHHAEKLATLRMAVKFYFEGRKREREWAKRQLEDTSSKPEA
jgi:hypothetical protein